VILLSARVGAEAVVEGLGSGAIDYVTKPFKMPELKARVETHLRTNAVEKQLDERETRLVAIGQMTGQIAHDLKGPLTAIVGHAELAREVAESTGSDAMIVQDLAAVEDAAHRAVSMIEQVVDFVREGSVPLRLERMPLTTFLDVTLEEQRSSLRPLGITLDLDVRATEPGVVVELDAGRMRRVVENLVTNAKEALVEQRRSGRRHGDRIVVSVSDDDEEWIQFRVMDNGPGFPIELAEELFQPFVTAGKEYGTGLGLAIVRNLVAAHGGSVTVEEPPPEGGAVFRVDLPRPTGP
jgi:signal transduction histidine kinase